MKLSLVALVLVLAFATAGRSSDSDSPSLQVKALIEANLKATQDEDINAVMSTMHAMSPGRAATKAQLAPIFKQYDLKYEVVDFKFVAVTGNYAIARMKQRTSKVNGPAFRNNTIDSLFVLKQDNKKWKFWTQAILEVKFE